MTKSETLQTLTDHGIPYELTEHPAVYNMEELDAVALPYPEFDAKNLFVRDDKKSHYYLITVKGDKRVDLKTFRKAHGLRNLSFASPDELAALLALAPGSVTPLGLLNDAECRVQLFLDAEFDGQIIGIHPNDNTATVWIPAADLVSLLRAHGSPVEWVTL